MAKKELKSPKERRDEDEAERQFWDDRAKDPRRQEIGQQGRIMPLPLSDEK